MRNSEFAKKDESFLAACLEVSRLNRCQDFKPSTRQASKWRNKKGVAFKLVNGLINPRNLRFEKHG